MKTFTDDEFGEILIKTTKASSVRLKILPNGIIEILVPELLPFKQKIAIKMVNDNRIFIRGALLKLKKQSAKNATKITETERKKLQQKAKFWLPRRLHSLATKHGFSGRYTLGKINNAKTRWGSCSNRGVISLNYALMTLPEELRDAVILHELTHLDNMDHSAKFWRELTEKDPLAKQHNKELKKYSPYL